MHILDKIYSNSKLYTLSLILLFFIAFAIPLLFAFALGGVMSSYMPESVSIFTADSTVSDSQDKEQQEKENVFPDSFIVAAPNAYIDVKHSVSLEPQTGKDFLISVWVKLKKLPVTGESYVIFSKYDEKSAARKGYSFSLTMEQENIRPGIYWRDENNNGTWFTFSEIEIKPKVWNLFVISFRNEKYLGLHTAQLQEEQGSFKSTGIKLLGGYELTNKILPQNKVDLLVGSFNSGKFRGKIGPVGIFSSNSLTENFENILNNLVEKPLEIPYAYSPEQVELWIPDGKKDLSKNNNSVSLTRPKQQRGD